MHGKCILWNSFDLRCQNVTLLVVHHGLQILRVSTSFIQCSGIHCRLVYLTISLIFVVFCLSTCMTHPELLFYYSRNSICDRACENRACGHTPSLYRSYLSIGIVYLYSVTSIMIPIRCLLSV